MLFLASECAIDYVHFALWACVLRVASKYGIKARDINLLLYRAANLDSLVLDRIIESAHPFVS